MNGVGKTTTIGKLAHRLNQKVNLSCLRQEIHSVLGQSSNLEVWGDRVGVEVIKQAEGSDPAAVMYDAVRAAKARKVDVLICDTAGRLQNKVNLMNELEKIIVSLRVKYQMLRMKYYLLLMQLQGKMRLCKRKHLKKQQMLLVLF